MSTCPAPSLDAFDAELPVSDAVRRVLGDVADLLFESWLAKVEGDPETPVERHLEAVLDHRWCDRTFIVGLSLHHQLELLELAHKRAALCDEGSVLAQLTRPLSCALDELRGRIHERVDQVALRLASIDLVARVDRTLRVLSDLGVGLGALSRQDPFGGLRAPLEIREAPHGEVWIYDRIDDQAGTATEVHEIEVGGTRAWVLVPSDR